MSCFNAPQIFASSSWIYFFKSTADRDKILQKAQKHRTIKVSITMTNLSVKVYAVHYA